MSNHTSRESGLIEASARSLLRTAHFAALATINNADGYPHASLVACTTLMDGAPLLFISKLALHTNFIEADPRICLLFSAEAGEGDPLDQGRLSITGIAEPVDPAIARPRFLARHPGSQLYIDFPDFAFWRLRFERAHYVGGFGRISAMTSDQFLIEERLAARWSEEIGDVIGHLNKQSGTLVDQLGVKHSGQSGMDWHIAACDPDGCDLISGQKSIYVVFPKRLDRAEAVEAALRECI